VLLQFTWLFVKAPKLHAIDGITSELEAQCGLPEGEIKLVAMIESADALSKANDIAKASPRIMGLKLGAEDFATSMGVSATGDLLRPAVYQVVHTACSAAIGLFAIPASMTDLDRTAIGMTMPSVIPKNVFSRL